MIEKGFGRVDHVQVGRSSSLESFFFCTVLYISKRSVRNIWIFLA